MFPLASVSALLIRHDQTSPLSAVPLSSGTLSELGRKPVRKAVVLGLPTIESSYATHTTKCIQGFDNPEYATLRVTLEVLNATESYLWVSALWTLDDMRLE